MTRSSTSPGAWRAAVRSLGGDDPGHGPPSAALDAVARVTELDHRCRTPELVVLTAGLSHAVLALTDDGPGAAAADAVDTAATTASTLGLSCDVVTSLAALCREVASLATAAVDDGGDRPDPRPDAAVLSDALLDPLGRDRARRARWWATLPPELSGQRVRRNLLARDTIFVTPESRGRLEGAARLFLAIDHRSDDRLLTGRTGKVYPRQ